MLVAVHPDTPPTVACLVSRAVALHNRPLWKSKASLVGVGAAVLTFLALIGLWSALGAGMAALTVGLAAAALAKEFGWAVVAQAHGREVGATVRALAREVEVIGTDADLDRSDTETAGVRLARVLRTMPRDWCDTARLAAVYAVEKACAQIVGSCVEAEDDECERDLGAIVTALTDSLERLAYKQKIAQEVFAR
jgi:hypothetical protein